MGSATSKGFKLSPCADSPCAYGESNLDAHRITTSNGGTIFLTGSREGLTWVCYR